ncbi:MAG: ABC transporter substrate-binding protein [Nitrososphaerota archaeon]|nr:ABC transporter substrate-binding protein [Candidatus Calditenuis fumarioli]
MRAFNPFVGWVEFKDLPDRIVSLNPSITETLFELGAGDRVVGVSSWCHRPREALSRPKVGSYTHLLEEKLISLKPDVVFTTTGAQRGVLERLVQLGIPTYPIPYPRDLYAILSMVSEVGGLIGEKESALKLCSELFAELNRLRSLARDDVMPDVYVEIDLGGPTIPGYFNHITHALHLAGLRNAFGDRGVDYLYGMEVKGYEVLDVVSGLREKDPDVIVFESKSFHPRESEGLEVMVSRGLSDLRAVREGRVLTVPADTLAHYGPSFVREVRKVLERVWSLIS